jgi:hypothetical protein
VQRALWLAVSLIACGRAHGTAAPVAAEAAPPTPGELMARAVHQRVAGAFRFQGHARATVLMEGKAAGDLDETAAVEQSAGGDLHARYINSHDQGRELYAVGGTVWVRPRYGKFHRRPPVAPEEAARAADDAAGAFAADFDLVAAAADVRDAGAATVAGRPARRLVLTLGPARPPAQTGSWRDAATVEALDGEAALDAATGVLLEGKLTARVGFMRDGRRFQMLLDAQHAVSDLGAAVTISPPADADSAPTPERSTALADREELLDGLAAPARR